MNPSKALATGNSTKLQSRLMGEELGTKWVIDAPGTQAGPFTIAEIQSKLARGEIREYDLISAAGARSPLWMPISKMLQALGGSATPFNPPPRPNDLSPVDGAQSSTLEDQAALDPALRLFDTLQAARERKPTRSLPPADSDSEWSTLNSIWAQLRVRAGWITALCIVIGFCIWRIFEILGPSSPLQNQMVRKAPLPSYQSPIRPSTSSGTAFTEAPAPPSHRTQAPYTPPPRPAIPTVAPQRRVPGVTQDRDTRERDHDTIPAAVEPHEGDSRPEGDSNAGSNHGSNESNSSGTSNNDNPPAPALSE